MNSWMKSALNIFLLLLSIQVFGQTDQMMDFYPLNPIDTIYNPKELMTSERIDTLNSKDYFFTYKDKKYKSGLLFTKKMKDNWIVYEFESQIFKASNKSINGFSKENDRFVIIRLSSFPSGSCSNLINFVILLNVENCKTIEFREYHHSECYNESAEVSSISECKSTIKINGNTVLIISNDNTNNGVECSESAEYEIKNDSLIKTK